MCKPLPWIPALSCGRACCPCFATAGLRLPALLPPRAFRVHPAAAPLPLRNRCSTTSDAYRLPGIPPRENCVFKKMTM